MFIAKIALVGISTVERDVPTKIRCTYKNKDFNYFVDFTKTCMLVDIIMDITIACMCTWIYYEIMVS